MILYFNKKYKKITFLKNDCYEKSFNRKFLISIIFMIFIIVSVFIFLYTKMIYPQKIYLEVINFLNQGKYIEAERLFDIIPEYENSSKIKEQMKYEKFFLKCFNNADEFEEHNNNIKINNVEFFYDNEGNFYCIANYVLKRSMDSNMKGYIVFDGDYNYIGKCSKINVKRLKNDDEKYISNLIIAIYNTYQKTTMGVNIDRVNNLIKSGNYENIP